MPYTTVTPPTTGTPISSSNFGIPIANNSAYFLNGKALSTILAAYAANFSLVTAATGAGVYNGFSQVDATSAVPGAMAMQNFTATSGRVQGVYYFYSTSDNTTHGNFQAWFTVGLLIGAYNGTFSVFDTGGASTGNMSISHNPSSAGPVALPFQFTGLSAGTVYSVAPYWRNWSLTGNGSITTTLIALNLVRGILWEN